MAAAEREMEVIQEETLLILVVEVAQEEAQTILVAEETQEATEAQELCPNVPKGQQIRLALWMPHSRFSMS